MKRIIAILKNKLEDVKLENKCKRVESALNNAKLNAETELLGIEDEMQSAIESLTKTDVSIDDVIIKLQSCINRKKEINEGFDTIAEIQKYLNTDIEIE